MSAIHIVLALIAALGLGATPSLAQTYPTKPVRIIVPTCAGRDHRHAGARALAQRLTDAFGQTVIVENRPAGAGQIGMDFVAKAAPDGYTLMVEFRRRFRGQSAPLQQAALRFDRRFHPDQRARHQPAGAGAASLGAGQYAPAS